MDLLEVIERTRKSVIEVVQESLKKTDENGFAFLTNKLKSEPLGNTYKFARDVGIKEPILLSPRMVEFPDNPAFIYGKGVDDDIVSKNRAELMNTCVSIWVKVI